MVDDFAMRLTGLINNLRIFGDDIDDERVVKKFLHIVPPRYMQVAISIETLVDLKMFTVEELIGRLKAVKERYKLGSDTGGMNSILLFIKEERFVYQKRKELDEGFSGRREW